MKMMKKTIPFLLAACLLSACTGGIGPETSPAKPAGETVSGAPSGSAELVGAPEAAEEKEETKQNVPGGGDSAWYEVTKDGQLTVRLPANPSTGYIWTYEADREFLQQEKEEYIFDSRSRNLAGGGGLWSASFRGVTGKSGKTELKLLYLRTFEAVAAEEKIFSLELKDGKPEMLSLTENKNVPILLSDGTHSVQLKAERLGEEDGKLYADVTEPIPVILRDEEVEALELGGMINLAPYGMSYIEVTEREELSGGQIRVADGATLIRDAALGGWKIQTYDDDIYEYEDGTFRLYFDEDVPFTDEMSLIAYDDAHRFSSFSESLKNYGNLRAEAVVKDGKAQKLTLRYHP